MTTCLITGAASGLGWALAQACHSRDIHLLLTDINADLLEQRRAELANGAAVHTLAGDLCEPRFQTELISLCQQQFGGLDWLINNAGITHRSPTLRTQPEVFNKVMAVDYHAPLNLTLNALPLLQRNRGQVICVGSMAGWMPVLGRAGYCAAKAALSQAFEVLRLELERQHIGLLMVYPSFLDTPIERNALGGDGRPASHARSTVGQVRDADWMAAAIVRAAKQRRRRLFPDRRSYLASLLWRLAPDLYLRLMARRFAGELD